MSFGGPVRFSDAVLLVGSRYSNDNRVSRMRGPADRLNRPFLSDRYSTVNGKPDAVLVDVETYERKLKSLNLVGLLAEGENDIRQGDTRSASTFLDELKRAKKISS